MRVGQSGGHPRWSKYGEVRIAAELIGGVLSLSVIGLGPWWFGRGRDGGNHDP